MPATQETPCDDPRTPYDCYWSRRALEAEKQNEAMKKFMAEGAEMMNELVDNLKKIHAELNARQPDACKVDHIRKIMEKI